ncbi:MAG: Abi family protein [Alphaproteobacteria bacterium]|nr:Abi family protein [Alphaproteobacteria bacterium]
MTISAENIVEIQRILSEPRFATYLQNCNGSRENACNLYQWNLKLSSAFIVPLHLIEVSIRNAAVECIEKVHTSNWPWTEGFIRRLPNPKKGYNPTRNLKEVARMHNPTMGKVVAELKFVFWEKMFTARYDDALWNKHIRIVFPNAPVEMTPAQIREEIHMDISEIRKLRNRIAHHEPIFLRGNRDDYDRIYKLLNWRSKAVAEWMSEIQTVTGLILERP